MLLKRIVLISLFLAFTISGFTQNHAGIQGKVLDEEGRPVVQANVRLVEQDINIQTDANGFYKWESLAAGAYTLRVSSIGFHPKELSLTLKEGQRQTADFVLSADNQLMESVTVIGKTEGQALKESGYAVNSIETKQYQNTTADLNQVLNRTTGVRIREQGGMGSNFNFSINGLSGKAVKYFIDGVPLDILGSTMSLNNIPVNLAQRIEVYKGVVPVSLGADAMGGVVNIITNQQVANYLDISHSYGSFNSHRSALSGQFQDPSSGLIVRANAFFNYSDNDYLMKDVEILQGGVRNGKEIIDLNGASFVTTDAKRFHDQFRSAMGQLEVGVSNKKWADVLFAGFGYTYGNQDQQTGFEQNIVYGNVTRKSKAWTGSLRYKKEDLFIKGLNTSLFVSHSRDRSVVADTLFRQYYWDGSWTKKGATEMGSSIKSLNNIIRPRTFARVNLGYTIHHAHSVNLNYTLDRTKNEIYNELFDTGDDMPGLLNKQILGLAYQQEFFDQRLTNTFFAKQYHLGLEQRNYRDGKEYLADSSFNNYGYGVATRYKLLDNLGVKASFERAYRLQEVEEMFGDGLNIQPNTNLLPEKSNNVNIGGYYSLDLQRHHFFLEASGFYRNAFDFIYPVPDQRSKALKNENKSNVRVTGFEAELRYHYADVLTFNINATYQNAINTTKFTREGSTTPEATYQNKIPNQPWLFGNADFGIGKNDVFLKNSRLQFNWYTQYVHWFYLTWEAYGNVNGKADIPSQLVHNAALSYAMENGRYNIALECRNLTDELAFDNFRLQKPGRAFSIKLRYFIH